METASVLRGTVPRLATAHGLTAGFAIMPRDGSRNADCGRPRQDSLITGSIVITE